MTPTKEKFNLKDFQINKPENHQIENIYLAAQTDRNDKSSVTVGKGYISGNNTMTITTADETFYDEQRPHFFKNDDMKLVSVLVDKELYDKINSLIEHFKQKKRFGFTEMNRVWKIIRPLVEKTFGEQEDS